MAVYMDVNEISPVNVPESIDVIELELSLLQQE